MVSRWIKNTSGGSKTWLGQQVADTAYYEIQATEATRWSNDSTLLTDIAAGDATVAKDDSGSTDITDINAAINHLKNDIPIKTEAALRGIREADGMRARLVGIVNQTITKNTTTDIDWVIPQLQYGGVNKPSYFDGIEYYVADGVAGDECTFQIVDKDGTGVSLGLYPQGYYDAYKDGSNVLVVEEFGTDWPLLPAVRGEIILYKARMYPGLYIRAKITSAGTATDPHVVMGIFRHLDGNS